MDEFIVFRGHSKSNNPVIKDDISLDEDFLLSRPNPSLKKKSIMIIDDDPLVLETLGIILEEKFEVIQCSDGDQGIAAINLDIKTVILDIKMQGKDGFEVFTEIKKRFLHLPIIFYSAYQDFKNPYEIMNNYHPFGYITKGENSTELLQTISSAVEYSQLYDSLEQKVEERTVGLEDALKKLKDAQAQLVQSEKMAGLGILVAGIAHEINNPTNFVSGGAQNLQRRLKQLEEFIYDLAEENREQIKVVFDSKFEPIYQNLEAVVEGSHRIRDIVKNLITFSQINESAKSKKRIIEGLQSTLKLVKPNYHEQIEFVESYEADPLMRCWHAQLNQVFMNIIINGCQAIVEKQTKTSSTELGKLTITTSIENNFFVICFQDTGIGISNDNLNKIFDPFFSTKPVGKGTGLGLSISFGIIEKHEGILTVGSVQGEGATFKVKLPLDDKR